MDRARGLAYTAHAGSLEIEPRLDVSYQSETFFDATNTPEIAQDDDITTVNARWCSAATIRNGGSPPASTMPPTRPTPSPAIRR
jgi:hypothetical protein